LFADQGRVHGFSGMEDYKAEKKGKIVLDFFDGIRFLRGKGNEAMSWSVGFRMYHAN
jgi:hypothetical protein